MKKVSIIIPVYKVEMYLARCLDSILNQIYTEWEAILIDDCSPDKSGAICAVKFFKLKLFFHKDYSFICSKPWAKILKMCSSWRE